MFLDFSKALITLTIIILLNKLYKYGIRGIAFKWMESYLSNQRQFVLFKMLNLTMPMFTRRVPKSPIMGPLLIFVICK